MIKLTAEDVVKLHGLLTEATGGGAGLRDYGLLESATEAAYATFGGEELFPTVEEKAARLGAGLIANHAFVDGNKRIGMLALLCFLELNGVQTNLTDDDIIYAGLSLAQGEMKYDGLLSLINLHKIN